MAIHLYCQKCFTSNGLDSKECSSCKTPFGRDRKYRVQVAVKGRRTSRVVDNLTIARELESSIKADLLREEFDISLHQAKKKPVTLDDVWEKYLPWAKEHKKTWRDDDYHYRKHLQPRFGEKSLESITPFDLEKMKSELRKGLSQNGRAFAPASIKHHLILVRRLFNLAMKWEMYQGTNPVGSVEMPKVDNQITEYMSDEELSRLLAVLDNWPFDDSAAFIRFALFTGLRRGELFKLQWSHVDFDRGMLTITGSTPMDAPKGGKSSTIPICKEALDLLEGLHRTSVFIFPGRGGKQRTDFKGPWARIRKAAGLPESFRFHGIRHHFASSLISNGVDLAVVGALLTHKQAQTTMRYAHLQPGALKSAATKAGELMQPKNQQKVVRMVK
jgi:integrase